MAQPGMLVANRYELHSRIGTGAMGAVWLALDRRLNRPAALKQMVLEPGLDQQEATEARQRILREGRIAARLQHPNAVSVYDITMHDGEPWLVMEYLPARSLAAVLDAEGALTDQAAARIGLQLADALGAAHQAGIVHRDVKPGNVLICPNGHAKLADFGIARAVGDITVTKTGVITGTPDYFAPEVARGGPPTPEADIFSLGATLYTCVEGEPPFGTNKNAMTQLLTVASGTVRPTQRAGRLAPVLAQLLDLEPRRRPSPRQAGVLLRAIALTADSAAASFTAPPTPSNQVRTTIPPPRSSAEAGISARRRALPPTPGELGKAVSEASRSTGRRRPRLLSARKTLLIFGAVTLLVLGGATAIVAYERISVSGPDATVDALDATNKPVTEAELIAAVQSYYASLPRDPGTAWRKLTPRAQTQLGGLSAYSGYWRGITSVRLINVSASAGTHTVWTQLRLETPDAQLRTTSQRLTLASGPDQQWLIDAVGG
ncbi:MAG: serine/threonine protein kinase [Pseudonocardia sp.]|nr:serine/threonine protein kinase [Pseudonocardia sp.]